MERMLEAINSNAIKLPKLTTQSFKVWEQDFMTFLCTKGLGAYIEEDEEGRNADKTRKAINTYVFLKEAVGPQRAHTIADISRERPSEAFTELRKVYDHADVYEIQMVRAKWNDLSWKSSDTVSSFSQRLYSVFRELTLLEQPTSQEDVLHHLIQRLPSQFKQAKERFEFAPFHTNNATNLLCMCEVIEKNNKKNAPPPSQQSNVSSYLGRDQKKDKIMGVQRFPRKPKSQIICHFCRKPGHTIAVCRTKLRLDNLLKKGPTTPPHPS